MDGGLSVMFLFTVLFVLCQIPCVHARFSAMNERINPLVCVPRLSWCDIKSLPSLKKSAIESAIEIGESIARAEIE